MPWHNHCICKEEKCIMMWYIRLNSVYRRTLGVIVLVGVDRAIIITKHKKWHITRPQCYFDGKWERLDTELVFIESFTGNLLKVQISNPRQKKLVWRSVWMYNFMDLVQAHLKPREKNTLIVFVKLSQVSFIWVVLWPENKVYMYFYLFFNRERIQVVHNSLIIVSKGRK